ncbi:MarR family winged helix-turn-helix transcriptional regulator, partial [Staphylococcus gallinarum]
IFISINISKENDLMVQINEVNDFLYNFYKFNKQITKNINNILKKYDITLTNYLVLLALDYEKETNIKSLAKLLDLDTGTLSPITKRLETKDLVIRNRSSSDERSIEVRLSTAGKELADNFDKISTEIKECLKISEYNNYLNLVQDLDSK